jgi:hypothetical protein
VLTFVLYGLGREDVNIPCEEDACMIDSIGAMSEDDKVILSCLEHVSRPKVYFFIEQLFAILTFIFTHALALSKSRIAGKALEATERSCIVELETNNAML